MDLLLFENSIDLTINKDYIREITGITLELYTYSYVRNEFSLNSSQMNVYNYNFTSVWSHMGKIFFFGWTRRNRKTFLINLLLSRLWSKGNIVPLLASSGIVATLLDSGLYIQTIAEYFNKQYFKLYWDPRRLMDWIPNVTTRK